MGMLAYQKLIIRERAVEANKLSCENPLLATGWRRAATGSSVARSEIFVPHHLRIFSSRALKAFSACSRTSGFGTGNFR